MSNRSNSNGRNATFPPPETGVRPLRPERSGEPVPETVLKIPGTAIIPPDPEVQDRPQKRRFSVAYKQKILREAELCSERGDLGALLRREGLYHSNLQTWREQRERGELEGLSGKKQGRKPVPRNPLHNEIKRLSRENERLNRELKKARMIIDVQKKISDLLGIDQPEWEEECNR